MESKNPRIKRVLYLLVIGLVVLYAIGASLAYAGETKQKADYQRCMDNSNTPSAAAIRFGYTDKVKASAEEKCEEIYGSSGGSISYLFGRSGREERIRTYCDSNASYAEQTRTEIQNNPVYNTVFGGLSSTSDNSYSGSYERCLHENGL